MATYYVGYRDILKGRSDAPNTYTGLYGVYSNWDLMNPSHVLDGAPDHNRVPGVGVYSWGGGEGDVVLSGMFLGTWQGKYPLANSLNAVDPASVNYFYGNFPDLLYHGLTPSYSGYAKPIVSQGSYGHLYQQGPQAAYAEWDMLYHGLTINQALATSRLGHIVRAVSPYTDAQGLGGDQADEGGVQAASFGSFQPYMYHGVDPAFGTGSEYAEGEETAFGKADPGPNTVGTANDQYGFEHVQEWFGVPSSRALDGGVPANGANSPAVLPPLL